MIHFTDFTIKSLLYARKGCTRTLYNLCAVDYNQTDKKNPVQTVMNKQCPNFLRCILNRFSCISLLYTLRFYKIWYSNHIYLFTLIITRNNTTDRTTHF